MVSNVRVRYEEHRPDNQVLRAQPPRDVYDVPLAA